MLLSILYRLDGTERTIEPGLTDAIFVCMLRFLLCKLDDGFILSPPSGRNFRLPKIQEQMRGPPNLYGTAGNGIWRVRRNRIDSARIRDGLVDANSSAGCM